MAKKNDEIEYILYKCPSCHSLFIENKDGIPFHEKNMYWIKYFVRKATLVIHDDDEEVDITELNKVDCWEELPDNSTYIEVYYKNIGW